MNMFKSMSAIVLLVFCFSFGMVMAQNDALIHQYKFDGNLEDAVGDSNGVFSDGFWYETVIDNFIEGHDGTDPGALNFDEANGYGYMIYVGRWSPSQEGTVNEMTVTFWGLWHGAAVTGQWQDIINKRDNYDNNIMWGITQHGPDHMLSVRRRNSYADSQQGMPEEVWTHVAISLDGVNAYFYMNGALYDTQPYEFGTGHTARIHMGSSGNDDGSFRGQDAYNGALDDVRFYSRVLTDAEILAIYQGTDTAVEDKPSIGPARFELAQNFPNPFNPTTQIQYTLGKNTKVEITVYDLLGHKVATLVNAYQNGGSHKVIWDASEASAGVYFYQMKTNDIVETRKMLLVK